MNACKNCVLHDYISNGSTIGPSVGITELLEHDSHLFRVFSFQSPTLHHSVNAEKALASTRSLSVSVLEERRN
jgi:hypothetical protein